MDEEFDIDEFLNEGEDEELEGFKVPDLATKPLEYVIDRLGVLKDRERRIKKYTKLFSENVKARTQKPSPTQAVEARGNQFEANISSSTSRRLSTTKVKETFSEEQLKDCYDEKEVITLRIKKL